MITTRYVLCDVSDEGQTAIHQGFKRSCKVQSDSTTLTDFLSVLGLTVIIILLLVGVQS